jgi:cyclase
LPSPAVSAAVTRPPPASRTGPTRCRSIRPALERPELIEELARDFGSQCVVLGVDSFARDGDYFVHQYTGSLEKTRDTGLRTLDWVREATAAGQGRWC